jgi:uncharacterized cupin superfamily protein
MRYAVLVLVGVTLLPAVGSTQTKPATAAQEAAAAAASLNAPLRGSQDPSHVIYTRLYCTPDGETHFQNVTVGLAKGNYAPPAAPAYTGGSRPVSTALFVSGESHWGENDLKNRINHPAPAVQLAVVLSGVYSVTATDGETRRFYPGDVNLLEDTAPCKGHITVVGDKPGLLMMVRLNTEK